MKKFLLLFTLLISYELFAQVAINSDGTTADSSAMLDIKSSSRGLLIPRMTFADTLNISSPALGLTIFIIDDSSFYFHKAEGWESIVTPPRSGHAHGLFATRTPRRPNPIGLTLIKLDKIEKNKLFVSGVDAFNNTPVLDIKPFLPDLDYVDTEKNRKAEYELRHHDTGFVKSDEIKNIIKP